MKFSGPTPTVGSPYLTHILHGNVNFRTTLSKGLKASCREMSSHSKIPDGFFVLLLFLLKLPARVLLTACCADECLIRAPPTPAVAPRSMASLSVGDWTLLTLKLDMELDRHVLEVIPSELG